MKVYFEARSAKEGSEPYELLAKALEKLSRKAELLPQLEQLHKADAKNQPLGHYLASQYLEAEQLDKAAAVLESLHKQDTSSESYRGLARVYRLQKRADALLTLLGQLVDETSGLDALDDEATALVEDKALVKLLIERAHKQLKSRPRSLIMASGWRRR